MRISEEGLSASPRVSIPRGIASSKQVIVGEELSSTKAKRLRSFAFVHGRRLWKLLAEQALEALDLNMAEKAFVLCGRDAFHGVRLVKRLNNISDRRVSRW